MTTQPYDRHRERVTSDVIGDWTQRLIAGYGPQNGTVYENQINLGPDTETMDDVVTPRYREVIAAGGIVNNPCVYESSKKEFNGSANQLWKQIASPYHEYVFGGQGYSSFRWANVDTSGSEDIYVEMPSGIKTRAKLLALSNIDKTPYAFGEDLGEIGETIRFLKSPFSSMLSMTKDWTRQKKRIVKRKNTSVRRKAELLSDAFLEFQFAFSPLLRSTYDLVEASQVAVADKRPDERYSARGFARDTNSNQVSETFSGYTFERTIFQEWEGHATILYTVSNPATGWRAKYGLRAKDFPLTLWQIAPLSFMVDRVIDISSAVSAVMNLGDPSVKIVTGSYRYKSYEQRTLCNTQAVYTGWNITGSGDTEMRENFTYNRAPWTPGLSDAVPNVTPGYIVSDILKITELGALILSYLKN